MASPPKQSVEILTIGTELTTGRVVNSNTALIAKALTSCGFHIRYCTTVPDDPTLMAASINEASRRAQIVFVSGGLGPTSDDLTTEVITRLLRRPLVLDPTAKRHVQLVVNQRKGVLTADALKMAMVPKGVKLFKNHNGMACGYYTRYNSCALIATPAVPHELAVMLEEEVVPYLKKNLLPRHKAQHYHSRRFKLLGIGEAQAGARLTPLNLAQRFPGMEIGYQVPLPEVHVILELRSPKPLPILQSMLQEAEDLVREALGASIYGVDHETLGEAVQKRFLRDRKTLALAESCTGGGVGEAITDIPGSSDYFLGGVVAYHNHSKERDLGVAPDILLTHGAVSAATAAAMASGVRRRFGSDVGLAVTGIAGPSGGSDDKPVGTVFIAIDDRGQVEHHEFHFRGERERIRRGAIYAALNLLRLL